MLLTSTSSLHHSVVPPMARGECCRPLPLGLLLSVVAPDFGGLSLLGRCRRGTAPGLPLDVATCTRHGCPSQGATGQNSSTENNLEGCLIILSIAYNAIYNLQPSPQYLWGGLLSAAKRSSLSLDRKEQIMKLSINIKYDYKKPKKYSRLYHQMNSSRILTLKELLVILIFSCGFLHMSPLLPPSSTWQPNG
jgi:hypothetical protein